MKWDLIFINIHFVQRLHLSSYFKGGDFPGQTTS